MQSSIIKGSVDWFIGQIDKVINPNLTFDINSYNHIYSLQDIFTQEFYKEGKISYPFLAYQIKGMSTDYSRMGSLASRKQGQVLFDRDPIIPKNLNLFGSPAYKNSTTPNSYIGGKGLDTAQSVKAVPVLVDLGLVFITNIPQQMEEFSINWIYNHLPELNGFVEFEGIEFAVTASLNTDIVFPEGEHEDNGLVYRLELSSTLATCIANLNDVAVVKPKTAVTLGNTESSLSVGGSSLIKVSATHP